MSIFQKIRGLLIRKASQPPRPDRKIWTLQISVQTTLSQGRDYQTFTAEATVNGTPAGRASARRMKGEKFIDIKQINVDEKYRNQGIGTAMLRWFFNEARLKNLDGVVLQVKPENTKAIKLYESLGGTRSGSPSTSYQFLFSVRKQGT